MLHSVYDNRWGERVKRLPRSRFQVIPSFIKTRETGDRVHAVTRMARNPRTGSPVEVSARPVPVFKPSKELRAMVAHLDVSDIEGDYEEANEA